MIKAQQLLRRKAKGLNTPRASEISGKVRVITVNVLVNAEDKEFHIASLPAGKGRLLSAMSKFSVSNGESADEVVMACGHGGFVDGMKAKTAPSKTAIVGARTVTGVMPLNEEAVDGWVYDAMNEVEVIMYSRQPLPVGAEIKGMLFYVID